MSYKIAIVDDAKLDYKKAINYYKEIDPKLGKRLNKSFKESLKILKDNPELFQIRFDDVRIKILKTFPYVLHFTIYEDLVIIKAFYHSSRNSKLNIF